MSSHVMLVLTNANPGDGRRVQPLVRRAAPDRRPRAGPVHERPPLQARGRGRLGGPLPLPRRLRHRGGQARRGARMAPLVADGARGGARGGSRSARAAVADARRRPGDVVLRGDHGAVAGHASGARLTPGTWPLPGFAGQRSSRNLDVADLDRDGATGDEAREEREGSGGVGCLDAPPERVAAREAGRRAEPCRSGLRKPVQAANAAAHSSSEWRWWRRKSGMQSS